MRQDSSVRTTSVKKIKLTKFSCSTHFGAWLKKFSPDFVNMLTVSQLFFHHQIPECQITAQSAWTWNVRHFVNTYAKLISVTVSRPNLWLKNIQYFTMSVTILSLFLIFSWEVQTANKTYFHISKFTTSHIYMP